ncbi:hypothetical protein K503DRAFT_473985 [Rhizopogon vinicolor AM-OR11-026]|uniref:Uncharacterized protein n=1 Tax=Rhizopogon vinicolor AM-OR11-026 TaxID=1314800 RepID=A0A1B7MN86_9AGAM|nr:hypothetical protein K503DRAFT_473985 [Rhizopogon vinicolor AM-OR11-026]
MRRDLYVAVNFFPNVISKLVHSTKCQTLVKRCKHTRNGEKKEGIRDSDELTFVHSTHCLSPPIDMKYYSGPCIHRLPVEILQQVFLFAVNDAPGCPSIFSFEYDDPIFEMFEPSIQSISANFTSPPLALTRVCRFWRVVAYSTTGIWSRIQVVTTFQDRIRPSRPFLPSLLRFWLARSGSEPLTLHIVARPHLYRSKARAARGQGPGGYSQLLGILLAEVGRWKTVTISGMPPRYPRVGFDVPVMDTPQLKTLECHAIDFDRFNAPNLRRLRLFDQYYLTSLLSRPTPTTKSIHHLHLQTATAYVIRLTAVASPHLETLVVDHIPLYRGPEWVTYVAHPYLTSMTLPVVTDIAHRQAFIDIFDELDLPVLQKFILLGELGEQEVAHVMAALKVASCHVKVVEFQTDTPQSEVDLGIAEPLLSLVEDVTIRPKG